MSAAIVLAVAAGGLAGAPARYLVDRAVNDRTESDLPWGTLAVNVTGSFLLGVLVGLSRSHHLGPVLLAWFGTGFCGAYTTFSTFTLESVRLVEAGAVRTAGVNVALSLATGIVAGIAGLVLGTAI